MPLSSALGLYIAAGVSHLLKLEQLTAEDPRVVCMFHSALVIMHALDATLLVTTCELKPQCSKP